MFTWVGHVRSAESAICPRVIVIYQYWYQYHNRNSFYTRSELHTTWQRFHGCCRSWWLPSRLPCTHCPTPQAHDHVELKQSISITTADVGGSSSNGSAAEDDLGSEQQGGSSADPGVDAIELFLPHTWYMTHIYVPLCKLYKLALAHTFTFSRVHPAWFSPCFTHVCQGLVWVIFFFRHKYMFSGVGSVWSARSRLLSVFRCDLYDLRDLDHVFWAGPVRSSSYTRVFLSGICMIWTFRTCLPGWDLYDLHDLHIFTDCDL